MLEVLKRPVVRDGAWRLVDCVPAWEGNPTADDFVACCWQNAGGARLLVAVNYAGHPSQCFVRLSWDDLAQHQWRFRDLLGAACYDRPGGDLASRGLYLDLPAWGHHVFEACPAV